jgi:tetratricopeptide (TPR) repeat protein
MPQRPNFYVLLELDPTVDDWPTIETRIVEKKRQWSVERSQGNPKAQRRAQRGLELLREIEATLGNEETRREEAKAARIYQREALKATFQRLDEAIAVLRSQGTRCAEAQFRKLVKTFSSDLTEDEVRKRLAAQGLVVGDPDTGTETKRPVREKLDAVTADSIRRNLEVLDCASLYELLGRRPQSSPEALQEAASELYRQSQGLGRTDAAATARNELAGIAKTVFADDAGKARYDNTLAVAAMEELKPALEAAGHDNFITREELETLLKQALKRGVASDRAREFIDDYAAKRKWKLQVDAAEPATPLRVCGFCGEVIVGTSAKACPRCGESLELDCPRCGTKNPSQNSACERCGCRVGDAPLVKSLLERGERHTLEGDLAEALRCFGKALQYWPGWEPAVAAQRRAEELAGEREAELKALDALVRRGDLLAARESFGRLARRFGSAALDFQQRRIAAGIARAEAAFAQGEDRRRRGDGEAALTCYETALTACADFEPARKVLATIPPPAPEQLTVHPGAAGFRLSWKATSASGSVSFVVVRKAGTSPQDEADGEVLGEVREALLDDASAPVGEPIHYAVFARRGGAVSAAAARGGPHLRLGEVEALAVAAGDGEVSLSWRAPAGSRRVEVWRRSGGIPARAGDGEAVAVSGGGVLDSGLTNGTSYGYRVVAVFADPTRAGGELRSLGIEARATPVALPPAITDLRCTRHGRTVHLSWTPVASATTQIRLSTSPGENAPGLIVPAAQADRFGTLVPCTGSGKAQAELDGQGRFFFIPLTVREGTAVVGTAQPVVTLDPVTHLAARRVGRGIALTWDWPPGGQEVLVAYAHDRSPQRPDDDATRVRVTRREYDRVGCWELRSAEPKRHYFSVFARASADDLYAPGVSVTEGMGQESQVSYRVVRRRRWLRGSAAEAWLELTCSDPNQDALPPLVVVGNSKGVPVSPQDGQVLEEVPGARFERGQAAIALPAPRRGGGVYVKLFFRDAQAAREVRLLPARREELWLG